MNFSLPETHGCSGAPSGTAGMGGQQPQQSSTTSAIVPKKQGWVWYDDEPSDRSHGAFNSMSFVCMNRMVDLASKAGPQGRNTCYTPTSDMRTSN